MKDRVIFVATLGLLAWVVFLLASCGDNGGTGQFCKFWVSENGITVCLDHEDGVQDEPITDPESPQDPDQGGGSGGDSTDNPGEECNPDNGQHNGAEQGNGTGNGDDNNNPCHATDQGE
jgi:hypothetical protein